LFLFVLIGLTTLTDGFAEFARMFAIECLSQGDVQGIRLCEVDRHGEPGDRLQGKPVAAGGNNQR